MTARPALSDRGRVGSLLDELVAVIADRRRGDLVAAIFYAAYAVLWTIYGVIAKSSQDIHFDMGEAVVWSREVVLGTPKHPPLSAWLVGVWFDVFPYSDWAYYLLSMTMVAVALWSAWKLSSHYLSDEKLAVGLVLLTFVPLLNFQALKFNANSVMIPLWAISTWTFFRSFMTRHPGWATAAGLAAAAAMLGKYWSIFLLLGLGIAALADGRRAAYFRSPAPWITIAVGAVALAPHIWWMATHNFESIGYALQSHNGTFVQALRSAPEYVIGSLTYLVAPILIVVIAAGVGREALADVFAPRDPDRRLALLAFALPLLLPMIASLATHSAIISLWSMGGYSLVPAILLSSPLVQITRLRATQILAIAMVFPLLSIAAAPVVALVIHGKGLEHHAAHYRSLAAAVERVWHETTDAPLRLVGGDLAMMNGIAFYAYDRPSTYNLVDPKETPWADKARIDHEGIAWVCAEAEQFCVRLIEQAAARLPTGKRVQVSIERSYLGVAGEATDYLILTTPPQ